MDKAKDMATYLVLGPWGIGSKEGRGLESACILSFLLAWVDVLAARMTQRHALKALHAGFCGGREPEGQRPKSRNSGSYEFSA